MNTAPDVSANAIVGGTEYSRLVERTIEGIQRAFCRRHQEKGHAALRELHSAGTVSTSLELALLGLCGVVKPGDGVRFRIFVEGKSRALKPAMQEQIFLIGREAMVNALRHSGATNIEAEVQYLRGQLRVFVRDNGCGIDPQGGPWGRNSLRGLLEMRERAESIGGRLRIWSRPRAGTEVQISVPSDVVRVASRNVIRDYARV